MRAGRLSSPHPSLWVAIGEPDESTPFRTFLVFEQDAILLPEHALLFWILIGIVCHLFARRVHADVLICHVFDVMGYEEKSLF